MYNNETYTIKFGATVRATGLTHTEALRQAALFAALADNRLVETARKAGRQFYRRPSSKILVVRESDGSIAARI
jgi:hypothetical protein